MRVHSTHKSLLGVEYKSVLHTVSTVDIRWGIDGSLSREYESTEKMRVLNRKYCCEHERTE